MCRPHAAKREPTRTVQELRPMQLDRCQQGETRPSQQPKHRAGEVHQHRDSRGLVHAQPHSREWRCNGFPIGRGGISCGRHLFPIGGLREDPRCTAPPVSDVWLRRLIRKPIGHLAERFVVIKDAGCSLLKVRELPSANSPSEHDDDCDTQQCDRSKDQDVGESHLITWKGAARLVALAVKVPAVELLRRATASPGRWVSEPHHRSD